MDGFGFNRDLPDSLNNSFKDRYIFYGNPPGDSDVSGWLGKCEELKTGHGTGFSSDVNSNHLSDRFGVELPFAKRMQKLYLNEKIAIIKYSKGGTAIDSLQAREFGC